MKKTKAALEIDLADITQRVLTGELKKMPAKVTLNLANATAADYQALLELTRYHSFGHQVMKSQPSLSDIQKVRSLIHTGAFAEALECALTLDPENAEVRIEKARALCFLGKFSEVPALLDSVFADRTVGANQRGVASQLLGHAHLELGNLIQANLAIDSARELATASGNVMGSISAFLFLSRIKIFENDLEKGEHFLGKAFEHVLAQGSFRWLLGYYRHLSHFSFFSSKTRGVSEAHAAILIAKALKDEVFEYRGILEIALMARKFGFDLSLDGILEKMESFSDASTSDVRQWMDAVWKGRPPHTFTAKRFLEEAGNSTHNVAIRLRPDLSQAPIWFYDRQNNLLVDLEAAEFSKISASGPLGKMIVVINSSENKMTTSELFEQIWKLRWSAEKHQNVLDVNLHRLSKIIKNLKIEREDSELRLSSKGLVF